MKKVLSIILSICMLLSISTGLDFPAYADIESGECGENVTYTYDDSKGELVISGSGDMYDYDREDNFERVLNIPPFSRDISYRTNSIVINEGVTSIGSCAFYNFNNFTSMEIPHSLTKIGAYNFNNYADWDEDTVIYNGTLEEWENISISPNNEWFSDAQKLFRKNDFQGKCGSNVSYAYSYNGSTAVLKISGKGSLYDYYKVSASPFYGLAFEELIIENGVTSIGENAFYCNAALKSVSIADSVERIESCAFYNCKKLTQLTLPYGLETIGSSAFERCRALTSINIPNSVTYISGNAFKYCRALTNIEIPSSVTSIGVSAFECCSSLTSVSIPDKVERLGIRLFRWCSSLKTVFIGNGLSRAEGVFSACPSLESVYLFAKDVKGVSKLISSMPEGSTLYAYPMKNIEEYCVGYGVNYVSLESSIACEYGYHNYNSTVTKKASCTKTGIRNYTCKYCGKKYTKTIPIAAHTAVKDNAVAATFKKAGKTEGSHCKVCGKIIKAQKTVAKLGKPSLSSVTAQSKGFNATWKSVKNIGGYQIQYSTSSSFKNAKKVTVSGYKSKSKTVKNLKAKKKYYVRIRAYKKINGKKQYSAWSAKKTVTTKK